MPDEPWQQGKADDGFRGREFPEEPAEQAARDGAAGGADNVDDDAEDEEAPSRATIASLRAHMERTWRHIQRALAQRSFSSREELERFVRDAIEHGLSEPVPRTPLDEAQELVYQAWETEDPQRCQELARQALAISADCADAYVILAEHAEDPQETIRLLEEGVRAGERALGPQPFAEREQQFWEDVFTRPYMRARAALADALWADGRYDEAIGHLEELLRLNPDDNMGLRYRLVSWYLQRQRTEDAGRLLERYDEDSAVWCYSRALWRYQREGESPRARAALLEALASNIHVAAYLLAPATLPEAPASFKPGSPDEALVYLEDGLGAWAETEGAILWLRDTLEEAVASALARLPRRVVPVGRNDPCPCGSGRKYKHCCGRAASR